MTLPRLAALALTALAIAIGVTACGDDGDATESGRLVIYAARSEELVGPLVERFSEESGIAVEVRYGGVAEIAGTLLEEGANSPADLFWTRDPGGLGAVSSLLTTLHAEILNLVPPTARSASNRWVGVSARVRTIIYNTERVAASELPRSLWNLTEPQWRGRVGWSPTSGPTQTMFTYMRLAWGEDETRRWLQAMIRNEATQYNGHTAVANAVATGEVDAGLVNHYYLRRLQDEHDGTLPARNYHLPEEGPGNLAMISGAGILETASNAEEARRFLEYLLSPTAQRYLTWQTYEYPLAAGVEANSALTPLADINTPPADMDAIADLAPTLALLREVGALP